ncbi:uncharacterized protein SCHCODRAFT_01031789 [Schizophyllum commune H4-8]|uniref:Uncharacterized protein n=1 Tax=Schizophyllum commune (strain H4-8 / FGSC 9210) TaxID=578458 RepID=D8PZ01_SCHCM|nr:uncharacterized protein SCHCODRAFT_01031789 [Schizophyllum commune H4-8]KAI5896173.1 hypothetical protein SCHCODRAFT_01031789 [Schizophyllum commune H4-8]
MTGITTRARAREAAAFLDLRLGQLNVSSPDEVRRAAYLCTCCPRYALDIDSLEVNLAPKELNSIIGHLRHIVRRAVNLSNLTFAVECLTATAEARIFRGLQIQRLYTMSIPPSSYATMRQHGRELPDGPHLPPIHLDSIAGPVSYVADALSRCNNPFPEIGLTDDIHSTALTRLRGYSVNFDIRKLTIDLSPYECSAARDLPECFPQLQCFNITEKSTCVFNWMDDVTWRVILYSWNRLRRVKITVSSRPSIIVARHWFQGTAHDHPTLIDVEVATSNGLMVTWFHVALLKSMVAGGSASRKKGRQVAGACGPASTTTTVVEQSLLRQKANPALDVGRPSWIMTVRIRQNCRRFCFGFLNFNIRIRPRDILGHGKLPTHAVHLRRTTQTQGSRYRRELL